MAETANTRSGSGTQTNHLARRVLAMCVTSGIATIIAIVGLALWMAEQANIQGRSTSQQLLATALQAEVKQVGVSVKDYAHWDFAYDLVTRRQDTDLYDNFGTGATVSVTFDFIYILDADGTPLYAYETDGEGSDLGIVDAQFGAAMYGALLDTTDAVGLTLKHFAYVGPKLSVVAATHIHPDDTGNRDASAFPVLIAGNWLSQARLDRIADQLLVDSLAIGTARDTGDAGQASLPVTGIDGTPVAEIRWTAPRPGQDLLDAAMPIILAVSALTFTTIFIVGRTAAAQTNALLEQQKMARTDRLTGLINRAGLEEIVTTPLVSDAIASGSIAMIYLDLNNFKLLNDAEGHDAGDKALQIFARRVDGALRKDDIIVRVGGDEFICILFGANPAATAKMIADRIKVATAPALRIGDTSHTVVPSIGVAIGEPNMRWQDLQKNADRAMYHAKTTRTSEPVFFSRALRELAQRNDLRPA